MSSFMKIMKRKALDGQLLLAIRSSDIMKASKLFQDGVDTDTRFCLNSQKQPAICLCVENNDLHMVQLMLKLGASINQTDSSGQTPLHIACEFGYFDLTKVLLRYKANSNAKNMLGLTPLHMAVNTGRKELVELLIDYGANVNAVDNIDQTPLHLASMGSNSQVVKCLLDAGANPQAKDKRKNTSLHFAAADSITFDIEAIDALSSQFPWAAFMPNFQNKTPLHIIAAIGGKNAECALKVILNNIPFRKLSNPSIALSPRTDLGYTPLHLAVLEKNVTLVRLLVAAGSQVDTRDQLGRTPLDCAVRGEDWGTAAILLAAGASIRKLVNKAGFLFDIQDEKIKDMLLNASLHPNRLSSLCRRTITTSSGPIFQQNLDQMPKLLRHFLAYEEL